MEEAQPEPRCGQGEKDDRNLGQAVLAGRSLGLLLVLGLRLKTGLSSHLGTRRAMSRPLLERCFVGLDLAALDSAGHRDVVGHHLAHIAQLTGGGSNGDPASRPWGA